MPAISRKRFLATFASFTIAPLASMKKENTLLSFSTLGCPDWTLPQVIDFAVANKYAGVEIRGIQRELDLPVSKHFQSPDSIRETKKRFADKGVRIVALGSSCELHHADAVTRQKNLDEGRRFIDLAAALECPAVRVFPNKFPPDEDRRKVMERISSGLNELAVYTNGNGVKVLMETHGDLTLSDDIVTVMSAVSAPAAGLVWDIANMWTIHHEAPSAVYGKLKKYIHHTHIKDLSMVGGKEEYCFLGRGDVPIFEAITLLRKDRYKGYFSFEWEKLWHPEIAAPELALADYPLTMHKHL